MLQIVQDLQTFRTRWSREEDVTGGPGVAIRSSQDCCVNEVGPAKAAVVVGQPRSVGRDDLEVADQLTTGRVEKVVRLRLRELLQSLSGAAHRERLISEQGGPMCPVQVNQLGVDLPLSAVPGLAHTQRERVHVETLTEIRYTALGDSTGAERFG